MISYADNRDMTNEVIKQNLPHLHFKPEGYLSGGDEEFLDQFLDFIGRSGFDPRQLVYSGFDGSSASKGEEVPRYPYVFVMNEAAWRQAITHREENPAEYAEGWDTPCIGLYDKQQLVHVYSSDIDLEDIHDRVELGAIERGEQLADIPEGSAVKEAVIHQGYPETSPTDALVGLVFIDEA